jgi:hypothetical protein
MNRLRKLGFISYGKGHSLHVYSSLLRIVQDGDFGIATRVDAWRSNECQPLRPGRRIALPATAARERLLLAGDGGQGLRNTAIYKS